MMTLDQIEESRRREHGRSNRIADQSSAWLTRKPSGDVLYEFVLGLWGVVNNLSRLRPVRWNDSA